jgi:hypothetical protein
LNQEWTNRLVGLVREEDRVAGRLNREIRSAKAEASAALATVERLEKLVLQEQERRTGQLSKLLQRRDDPVVLVRNYGLVGVYHSSEHPCGWAFNTPSFTRFLLSEAVEQGCRPCKSCGALVPHVAAPDSMTA